MQRSLLAPAALQHQPAPTRRAVAGQTLTRDNFFAAVNAATQEVQSSLARLYRGIMRDSFFLGGWSERPDFDRRYYEQYPEDIQQYSPDTAHPQRLALIGANKIFGLHEMLGAELRQILARRLNESFFVAGWNAIEWVNKLCELKCFAAGTLTVEGAVSFSGRLNDWDRFTKNYEWKNLLIQQEEPRTVRLEVRAASTDKFGCKVDFSDWQDTEEVAREVCAALQVLHRAVLQGGVIYTPTVFLDEANFPAQPGEKRLKFPSINRSAN